MFFLAIITSSIKNAVLQGFREAIEELGLEQSPAPDPLAAIKARLAPAALAAPEAEKGKGKGK